MTNQTKDRIVLTFYDSNIDNTIIEALNGLVSNKRNRASKIKELLFTFLHEHPEIVEMSKNSSSAKNETAVTKFSAESESIIDSLF